jgi:hypothetical protein
MLQVAKGRRRFDRSIAIRIKVAESRAEHELENFDDTLYPYESVRSTRSASKLLILDGL